MLCYQMPCEDCSQSTLAVRTLFFSPNKPPLGDADRSDLGLMLIGATKVYLEGLKEMLVT